MMAWITDNISTLAIAAAVAVLFVLALISVFRRRKSGGSCSCGCENCMYSGNCTKAGRKEDKAD